MATQITPEKYYLQTGCGYIELCEKFGLTIDKAKKATDNALKKFAHRNRMQNIIRSGAGSEEDLLTYKTTSVYES